MPGFIDDMQWRGMVHDIMPGTEELLARERVTAYVGIDPTADSLHIGHLVSIMMLKHLQLAGHRPIALVGGATGMIGDPSGRSEERNLLDEETLRHNQNCLGKQLLKFLDFNPGPTQAILVNNYDWMKEFSFLGFLRDVGKHLTVNYMMAKDSVKKRLDTGLSFTEFSYQLVQGYDFLHLYQNYGCKLQMGGSDQWGNITSGTELIRRKLGGEAYAMTCPLITKSDGGKFGKTEQGNVWLDPLKTSAYHFYQFWMNCSDEDAERYIKIFTLFSREEIEAMIEDHRKEPHGRLLQRTLARDLTHRVHSEEDLRKAEEASAILFGKGSTETLRSLDEALLLEIFEGVPRFDISRSLLDGPVTVVDLMTEHAAVFASKGEARRSLRENAVSLNKARITEESTVDGSHLLNGRYLLVQRGKKNYFLIRTV